MANSYHSKDSPIASSLYVMQPNRIIETTFPNYTLLMHKVITAIALSLNESVDLNYNKRYAIQLDMFRQTDEMIFIKIPYRNIVKDPSQYKFVRAAILRITSVVFDIPYVDGKNGKKMHRITNFFRANVPNVGNYESEIEIEMEKKVVEHFIHFEQNADNKSPGNFTKYLYDVTQNASSKYTPPIYKILASWRTKNGREYNYSDFRKYLGIPEHRYKTYADFKKKVLKPVQNDLYEKADLWFDCNRKDFKKKKGNEIILCFNLITPKVIKEQNLQTDNVIYMLRNFGFKDADLKDLYNILYNKEISKQFLREKISEIESKIYSNNENPSMARIEHVVKYMSTSLKNYFEGRGG